MPKRPASFREKDFDPNRIIQYSHDTFTRNFGNGVKVSVSEKGIVVITQDSKENPDEFDEITVPASIIYKIAFMLDETRHTKSVLKTELHKS